MQRSADVFLQIHIYFRVYTYECIHVRSTPSLSFVATRLRMASFLNSLAHWLKKCFSYWRMVKLLHFYFWLFPLISTYHHTTHTHTDAQNCAKAIQLSRKKFLYYISQIFKHDYIMFKIHGGIFCNILLFRSSRFFLSQCLFPSGSNDDENENDTMKLVLLLLRSLLLCVLSSKWKGLILVCSEYLPPHMLIILGILKIMGSSLSPHACSDSNNIAIVLCPILIAISYRIPIKNEFVMQTWIICRFLEKSTSRRIDSLVVTKLKTTPHSRLLSPSPFLSSSSFLYE